MAKKKKQKLPLIETNSSIEKVPTQVNGLDDVLNGGVPKSSMTLLSGGPGTGKTMIGFEFLVRGALEGHPGILLTFEEMEGDLRNYAQGFGWDIDKLEKKKRFTIISARIQPDAILSGDFDLRGILSILRQKAKKMKASRLLIDAPDAFLRLLDNIAKERMELYALHEWLRNSKMTTIMTVKGGGRHGTALNYDFLDYLADCVVYLDQRVLEQVTTRRLRVIKYRGSAYDRNEYPFCITNTGVWIIPVTRANLQHRAFGEPLSSGVPGLDKLLGGGFRRNTCTLITGSSGTGKTTFACSFALAATANGERLLYLDFEESWEALVSCMLSPGIDLREPFESGKLKFLSSMPESQGIEEHLIQAFRVIQSEEPTYLIVDAISACRRMGSKHAAFDYLLRLIDHCKRKGITTFLTNLTPVNDPQNELTGLDLSSVIDTVILLRNVETNNKFHRELAILKSRGHRHSTRVHSFEITDQGIVIAAKESNNG